MAARDERDPGLPVLGPPASNGEYAPVPLSPVLQEAQRRARALATDSARRLGVSRREFLLGVCGAATSLLVLDACSRESNGGRSAGRFEVPTTATTDPDEAREVVGGDELIVDVQGHLLDYSINPKARGTDFGSGFPQARCGEADPRDCFSIEHFLELVFLQSDTDIAVLSSIPVVGDENPLTIDVMEETKRIADAVCGDGRILMQGQAVPNLGRLDAALDAMSKLAGEHRIGSWKTYTHAGGRGWFLDDHDPRGAQVGEAFLRRVVDTGVRTVSVHKGLSGGDPFASPVDIGPAAARHRDVRFVVYHSGYESGQPERAYDPNGRGIDRLLASMDRAGIGPNENVYAELGSTWFNLMRSPDDAAHALGKLVKRVGENNVVWGTDSIWYGSPQPQIQAFRAFQISEELQEQQGYPALTPEIKAKILGGNAARLYAIDASAVRERCTFTPAELEEIRTKGPGDNQALGPRTIAELRAHQAAHAWPGI